MSLTNDTVFTPKNKKSFVWGSALANKNYKSNIGFCFKKNGGLEEEVEIDFYSEKEMLISKKFNLKFSNNYKDILNWSIKNSGNFGITGDCKEINAEEVELLENHKFEETRALFWRNSNLNFNPFSFPIN